MKRESSGEGQVNGKRKWILSVVVAVIAALVVFAPMPVPHFADFTTVCDTDGQEADVTVKARFVYFKPLFFQYGESTGYFPIGSIKIYDNDTDKEICDLKLDAELCNLYQRALIWLLLVKVYD